MNYINYINEVVKPQENKNLSFKFDTIKFNKKFKKAPSIEKEPRIIKEPFLAKRDLIISYEFENLYGVHLNTNIGFDSRGMCIDVGPIREWNYNFWRK